MLFPDGQEQRSVGIKRSPNLQVICHHIWCTTEVPERHTKYCIYSKSEFCEECLKDTQNTVYTASLNFVRRSGDQDRKVLSALRARANVTWKR